MKRGCKKATAAFVHQMARGDISGIASAPMDDPALERLEMDTFDAAFVDVGRSVHGEEDPSAPREELWPAVAHFSVLQLCECHRVSTCRRDDLEPRLARRGEDDLIFGPPRPSPGVVGRGETHRSPAGNRDLAKLLGSCICDPASVG